MIAVTVREDLKFKVREPGYADDEVTVAQEDLSRLFKAMIKRALPLNSKVRFLKYVYHDEF
jgi:hypothetical protein